MNVALPPPPLNLLSLCTGGGGLDLGVELALPGARSVCMVEREAFAVAHLVAAMEQGLLHPAAVWSDARTFDGRPWRGLVDGLIGGIPCQPHSLAGRKRGQLDERDLWSTARRIVVGARPWFVLIENVSGMLAAGDDEVAGAERVRGDLLKLGFTVEGGLFTAAEVGDSQERERLFILAVADRGSEGFQGSKRPGALSERHGSPASGPVTELRPLLFPPGPAAEQWPELIARHPMLEPSLRRVADGLASPLDQLRLLGNGVVPLAAANALRTLIARLAASGAAGAVLLARLAGVTP